MQVKVLVDKIRSYQTLVYKNGQYTYSKKAYTDYKKQITNQLVGSSFKIENDKYAISLELEFECTNRVVGDLDNISKPIIDILQNHYNFNDKYITELKLSKKFGYDHNKIKINIKEIENGN